MDELERIEQRFDELDYDELRQRLRDVYKRLNQEID